MNLAVSSYNLAKFVIYVKNYFTITITAIFTQPKNNAINI
jgi:hypothetical protein